jgi:hypothetical protein
MWEELTTEMINEPGPHNIEYQLKDGRICSYLVRQIRHSAKFGDGFIDVYCSSTDTKITYWDWKTFKISSIKEIDGKTLGEYTELIKQKRKKRLSEEKKNNNSSRSYQDAGCFIAGGLSIIGFILGGALAEIEGAIGGLILGLIVGYYIGNRWEKRK